MIGCRPAARLSHRHVTVTPDPGHHGTAACHDDAAAGPAGAGGPAPTLATPGPVPSQSLSARNFAAETVTLADSA